MNDKDKQIRQMACAMCGQDKICGDVGVEKCVLYPDYRKQARRLYEKGYRKQSEGAWIKSTQTHELICNLCGAIGPVDCLKEDFYESNFCPNCGAIMKGSTD